MWLWKKCGHSQFRCFVGMKGMWSSVVEELYGLEKMWSTAVEWLCGPSAVNELRGFGKGVIICS